MKRATCTTVTKDREEEKKDVEVDQTTRQVADPIASVKEPQLKRRHLDEVKQVYVASDPAKVRPINDTVERDDVRVVDGNLFEASSDMALAHCVSCDMKMGRGIAREFVRRFGNRGLLLQQHKKIGEVAYLMHGDAKRPIFYMITKERYWQKPTYTSLTQALQCLVKLCQSLTIKTLAMPRIGCGLDKLKWSEVEPIIRREFKLSGIVVTVYDLPKSTVHETKKFTSDTKTSNALVVAAVMNADVPLADMPLVNSSSVSSTIVAFDWKALNVPEPGLIPKLSTKKHLNCLLYVWPERRTTANPRRYDSVTAAFSISDTVLCTLSAERRKELWDRTLNNKTLCVPGEDVAGIYASGCKIPFVMERMRCSFSCNTKLSGANVYDLEL